MLDGHFLVSHPGKLLQGSVLSESNHIEEDCETACLLDSRCKSININSVNGAKCQLNSRIVGDSGTDLVARSEWTYKTTNFSTTQVIIVS